jgi:redox-sensitive bicupin YhaK (pirin superfamily)
LHSRRAYMKKIRGVSDAPGQHWVGDGFPVRSLFSYQSHGEEMSPFLLLDYAGPRDFPAADRPRGVGQHPHRGFETVTIVYQGEVEHRDSTGGGGKIGPGEVQWMTAGGGLLHEEFHSTGFTQKGGTFEVVQLWVNLPARDKMIRPGYQAITRDEIPVAALAGDAGTVRVIAGDFEGTRGPAHTYSPMHVWDIRLHAGSKARFDLPEGWTSAVVVLRGTVLVNDAEIAREAQLVMLERDGTTVSLEANNDTTLLVLSGEPLSEPVVGYGPFVMNTREQITQAIEDFNSGRFGRMA